MVSFGEKIAEVTSGPLRAISVDVLQANLGYICNLSCKHCHVGAGPGRKEAMDGNTTDAVLDVLRDNRIGTLDITGGSPELNPNFNRLVSAAKGLGMHVMARSNLTVFFEPSLRDISGFLAEHNVEIIASLPYYLEENVDRIRGGGVFQKCIEAMRILNGLGYGNESGIKRLNLVYNPQGAFLAPEQEGLESEYKRKLKERHGVSFNSLYAFSNMPIGRFGAFLDRTGSMEKYLSALYSAFNPETLQGIMCRRLVNVGWDGRLYDCDFNQALGIGLGEGQPSHVSEFEIERLSSREISVGDHCYVCTAGQGST